MSKKRISITDIAEQLSLSISTVSRALSDHPGISDATKKRVIKLAKAQNYQPNYMAAALRKGRSNLLGIIVPHIDGHFFTMVVKGIEAVASKAGFNVLICQSNEDVAHESTNVDTLINAQVDGILVSLARTTRDSAHFDKVLKQGIPLVFFDRILEGKQVNAVVLDDREGGYLSTKHLLQQGYRRIAHFGGPQHLNIYKYRRLGYEDALREANLPIEPAYTVINDMTLDDGIEGMKQLLDLPVPPDAVFSASDFSAVGALQLLKSRHIQVPQEIAISGFSNETFTALTEPMITSVDQRCEQMGQSAVELFLQILREKDDNFSPRRIVLQPDLVIRNSTARSAS
ncbi:LacI family DNA-binding transcriptional regulator [Hymenobacter sp. YC55]|uniref:LacI family DNA-binding transcriptional regulator n=1 Tax=Hymenobacter sp. YC55 TaxID=3034019 RepID=UPI0023F6201D|nr:LacI family DNA-binding transcriptional regulator [Hymenobacter sp. YC55]MDF7815008.1 LacI family DNA-binding transcriptional regulator [Hymenobacter sp. YC55]